MTISDYPTDTALGALVLTVVDQPIEYQFERFLFEDGSAAVNVQPCGVQRWDLLYDGLSQAQRTTLADHFNEAMGRVNSFSFTHPRTDTVYTGVKYVSWEPQNHTKNWSLGVRVVLEKLI